MDNPYTTPESSLSGDTIGVSHMEVTFNFKRRDFVVCNTAMVYFNPIFSISFALFSFFFTYSDLNRYFDVIGLQEIFIGIIAFIVFYIKIAIAIIFFNFLMSILNFKLKKGVLCKHKITATSDSIIETTEFNETKHNYNSISKLTFIGPYIFIIISSSQGHCIPTRYFSNKDEAKEFYGFIKNNYKA